MEQKNLSVFGDIVRNEEIADFIRLVNLTRDIFHQEMTTLEIMPDDFQTRDEVLNKAGRVMRWYHDSGMEFKTSFDPISKIDEYKTIMAEHKYEKRYEGWDRIVENPLDEKCEETFLRAYCGGEPSDEARARVLINKFLVTSHWSTWSLVQICYGKDPDFYWEYGRTRAVQACSFLDDPNFGRYLEIIGG